jgi:hypothetical protein
MSFTTKEGDKIAFIRNGFGGAIMTVVGPAEEGTREEVVELTHTELMALQDEVYAAIHGVPDPVVVWQKADDERIKRLVTEAVSGSITTNVTTNVMPIENEDFRREFKNAVKEAFAEMVTGDTAPVQNTFVQNVASPISAELEIVGLICDFLYGPKSRVKSPRPTDGS